MGVGAAVGVGVRFGRWVHLLSCKDQAVAIGQVGLQTGTTGLPACLGVHGTGPCLRACCRCWWAGMEHNQHIAG